MAKQETKRGDVLGWVNESGVVMFAVLLLSDVSPDGTFKGIVIRTNTYKYNLGDCAYDWYIGSYVGSATWVKMNLEILL